MKGAEITQLGSGFCYKGYHLTFSGNHVFILIIKMYLVSGGIVLFIDSHPQDVSIDFLIKTRENCITWFFMMIEHHF